LKTLGTRVRHASVGPKRGRCPSTVRFSTGIPRLVSDWTIPSHL
jgi:hypothetical protein